MKQGKGGTRNGGLLPSSLRIISSCLKTVSSNAGSVATTVCSAGASVAASMAALPADDEKDQVLWVGFDKLDVKQSSFKRVLLIGYSNGFQVIDVDDASNFCELVSKRDSPVVFLQMQPMPAKSDSNEGFRASHPMLLVVAGDETNGSGMVQGGRLSALIRDSAVDRQTGTIPVPTVVRFYSLKSSSYVHLLRFRSAVYIVRCSPRIVAVALAAQIYCFDAVTLEKKFNVLTYPLQGSPGVNIGYGPMAVGPRWLAYSSNTPLLSSMGRLSPQNLTPSPGVSPSTSPSNGGLVARYAMESGKQIAAGIINLGDMGYKTISRYCQDLIPDGSSSPLSSSPVKRAGKVPSGGHSADAENAGMVVIQDFISKDVISQFRAHTSPISALCFDPSGTLLVTASVHGHNINVFRIMPTCMPNGSETSRYDWASSHVHLYKLYRGLTAAVIQDISFSHYSQWIAIVSSHGTCHIFTLSPFGGDASLQQQNSHSDGPALVPNLSSPWWSKTSFFMDQKLSQPPSPITLSVASRIKNSGSGWLNAVSNAAVSATGKVPIPSGAIVAVFHNSVFHGSTANPTKANHLEHLLVYSPSGHVVQHALVPSASEPCDNSTIGGSGSHSPVQDDELHVNAEPIQWWDVCRRINWPEREGNILRLMLDDQQNVSVRHDDFVAEDNGSSDSPSNSSVSSKDNFAGQERPKWYLSNAEVQINSGRVQIWHLSKIYFYVMDLCEDLEVSANSIGGEFEIEMLPVLEVETRRRELLPTFNQHGWNDRGLADGNFSKAFMSNDRVLHPTTKYNGAGQSNGFSPSFEGYTGSTEKFVRPEYVVRTDSHPRPQTGASTFVTHKVPYPNFGNAETVNNHANPSGMGPMVPDKKFAVGGASNEIRSASITNVTTEHSQKCDSNNSEEFTQYFHEGYCNISELNDCRETEAAATDGDSNSSHCEREKPEEEGESDDILGGVFAFSEEG